MRRSNRNTLPLRSTDHRRAGVSNKLLAANPDAVLDHSIDPQHVDARSSFRHRHGGLQYARLVRREKADFVSGGVQADLYPAVRPNPFTINSA
jgi:hypothetical protein